MKKEEEDQLIDLAVKTAMLEIKMFDIMKILGNFLVESAKEVVGKMTEEEKQEFLKELLSKNDRSN